MNATTVCHRRFRRTRALPGYTHCARKAARHIAVIALCCVALVSSSIAEIQLGSLTFAKASAMTLPPAHLAMPGEGLPSAPGMPPNMSRFLNSYAFVSGVGGVAFGGIAAARDDIAVKALTYDPKAADGTRLRVDVASRDTARRLVVPAYDWEFIPAARFVQDNGFAVFTYFGSLLNESDTDRQRRAARGERVLNYHPAFVNTLMGLRIMQADILLLYADACDLPKQDGRYVLGPNEKPPDVAANRRRQQAMRNYMQYLPGGPFRSYVICDYKREVSFSFDGTRLRLSGTPIWFCWKDKVESEVQRQRIHQTVQDNANRLLNAEFSADQRTLGAAAATAKYTPAYRRTRFEALYDKEMSERMLQHMPDYSVRLTAKLASLEGINPAVFRALSNTMQLAAFFRHVRQTDSEAYGAFVETLREVTPLPVVETPTILYEPGTRAPARSGR